jgi:hypothetical protein
MFFLVQRTDTIPEQRALVNSDHIVAVLPTVGGSRSKLYLDNGEGWEISLPFAHLVALFRNEAEISNALPAERPRGQVLGAGAEPLHPPSGGLAPPPRRTPT